MTRRLAVFGILIALALAGAACAAVNAFRKGETAMKEGDLDQAVAYYRTAVQAAPDNANYRIALERAMQAASRMHIERAKDFEQKDQLDAALGEYKLASEYEPSNRLAVAKVAALERTIRDRIEAHWKAGATHVSPILLHLRPTVREEFMSWLGVEYPELVTRYEDLYRTGAYASQRERNAAGRRVGDIVRAAGGITPRPGVAARFRLGRDGTKPPATRGKSAKQLSLL